MRLRFVFGLLALLILGGCVVRNDQPTRKAPKASASRTLGESGQAAAPAPARSTRDKHANFAKKLTVLQSPKGAAQPTPAAADPGSGHVPRGPPKQQIDNVVIKNYGDVIYQGPMDLRPTIRRILAGERDPHRNDGMMFRNREGRLPKRSRAYYREYVHRTAGLDGPGPQRIVVGQGGDWYYSPDHYASFIPLQ